MRQPAIARAAIIGAAAMTLLTLPACRTAKATGAVAGAVGGAAVGGATAGARATGAAVGAAGGAIVGAAVDRNANATRCFDRGVEVACPPE
ncbi:uncharacterized protein YcfJ [Polymorphobacter fuscus]|uniref:glycine zipper domain-containing protein n=1 Tax=Sandarakinorhabdus fusca TaxID=1439888 RepID=UPI0016A4BE6B|nr:uncharacterized protein YcfJ [Polymorphobacter fuscus]